MGATANDYQALESVRIPVRVEVMYTYLCDQRGYNMQEVAELVLGDRQEQSGKRVSSIMRCYGFSGNNSRRYHNRALKQDIEDFVRSYPRGAGEGEFDRFLNQRLQQRKQMADNQKKQEQEAGKWSLSCFHFPAAPSQPYLLGRFKTHATILFLCSYRYFFSSSALSKRSQGKSRSFLPKCP